MRGHGAQQGAGDAMALVLDGGKQQAQVIGAGWPPGRTLELGVADERLVTRLLHGTPGDGTLGQADAQRFFGDVEAKGDPAGAAELRRDKAGETGLDQPRDRRRIAGARPPQHDPRRLRHLRRW